MAEAAETSILIPALNESESVGQLVSELKSIARWREIIVIDDGSTDGTADGARRAGAVVVSHPYNKGNGAAVKTGVRRASGDYVVIIDGDGQHRPTDVPRLLSRLGEYDLVIGARTTGTQANYSRLLGNSLLNWLAAYLTGRAIPDLTSGFRAARTVYLKEFLYLLPNGFSTPTTTTLAFIKAGYNVSFEPVEARPRAGRSKIRLARDGVKFFLIMLKIVTIFSPLRIFLPISFASFVLGTGYAIWTVATQQHVTNSSVLLILVAVVIFLVGLIAEQISSLRFQSRE